MAVWFQHIFCTIICKSIVGGWGAGGDQKRPTANGDLNELGSPPAVRHLLHLHHFQLSGA